MILISGTEAWAIEHPGGKIGLLELSNVTNHQKSPQLGDKKREIEAQLKKRYGELTRRELVAHPVMSSYKDYYKRFRKTYHVQLQVESIVHKGKQLPNVSPLVDANFMAEVETFILTAGHDVEKLCGEVIIDVSREGDVITQMNGTQKHLPVGDMVMKDEGGICCSVIYGQDNRSIIRRETSHVLFVAYAPSGVSGDSVETQLQKIGENVCLFSPKAKIEQKRILIAE